MMVYNTVNCRSMVVFKVESLVTNLTLVKLRGTFQSHRNCKDFLYVSFTTSTKIGTVKVLFV